MSAAARRGERLVAGGDHQEPVAGPVREVPDESGPNRVTRARNVSGAIDAAQRHVHHIRLATREGRRKRFGGDVLDPGVFQTEHRRDGHPRLQRVAFDAPLQHHRVAPPHLHEPGRGHRGAHAVAVDEDDARAKRADLLVGGLHELAARDPPGVGQVAGLVLLAGADVEDEERTPAGFRTPSVEGGAVDGPHVEALRDPRRRRAGLLEPHGGRPCRMLRLALGEREPREVPCHGAVSEADHAVGHAGVDDRLRADDAPGPARAVHDDGGVRRRDRVVHAVGELGAGAAYSTRNAEVGELGRRPAVQNDDIVAGREHRVELLGGDRGRAELVLDHLPERLARDVDAADQREAGRRPGIDAAFQHGDGGVAEVPEPVCGPFRLAGPCVAHHDGRGVARYEPGRQALESGQRTAARVEDVRVVERADLAGVEQRELVVAEDHLPQLVCIHRVHLRLFRCPTVAIRPLASGALPEPTSTRIRAGFRDAVPLYDSVT